MAAAVVDTAATAQCCPHKQQEQQRGDDVTGSAAADLLARGASSAIRTSTTNSTISSISSRSSRSASTSAPRTDTDTDTGTFTSTDTDERDRNSVSASSTALAVASSPSLQPSASASAVPPSPSSMTVSCAMTVLTAVERSVLRMLAFVFYQLDRDQAKFCASSILRGYFQLQTQLPDYAVESLERVAASVIALSDAKFTTFWLSLLEKEIEINDATSAGAIATSASGTGDLLVLGPPEARITIQSYDPAELRQAREKTLVRRLYQHIYCSIRSLFVAKRSSHATQTPCTSPIDLTDESHYQKQSQRRRHSRCARYDDDDAAAASHPLDAIGRSESYYGDSHNAPSRHADEREDAEGSDDNGDDSATDVFEPGWAVEYMEQESTVSSELTRRMRKMMHSSIPLNLFRVTVAYNSDVSDDADDDGFVGIISPESFPPTPITRNLQTQRMNCYTARVLDHTTLALRLLEANSYSRTYQQLR